MVMTYWFYSLLLTFSFGEVFLSVDRPETGPGSSNYQHQDVLFQNFAEEADGYWLFEPIDPKPDSAPIVVFSHGYGAYNPMIYGQWIRHLVQKGNIVIYPRYQKNLFIPKPKDFGKNAAKAIRDAIIELQSDGHVRPILDDLVLVGHSYGGVISADLAANYEAYGIPKPKAAMLCAPGTGILKGGRLETYQNMPKELKLLIFVEENDRIVGDEFAQLVFETATNTPNRNLIIHYKDKHEGKKLRAKHNECYAIDWSFDSGNRNITARRALGMEQLNEVDFYGYWKLLDALMACSRSNEDCDYALGNTKQQSYMGKWDDGKPIKALEVQLPLDE